MPINYGTNDVNTSGIITAVSGNFSTLRVNSTGVSLSGHNHVVSDISNFNSSVSGLLPTISNSGDNRILTSTGSSVGINAENNLTFDGSLLRVIGSGIVDSGIYFPNDGNYSSIKSVGNNLVINSPDSINLKSNSNHILTLDGDGLDVFVHNKLGIGTTNPSTELDVVGNVSVAGTGNFKDLEVLGELVNVNTSFYGERVPGTIRTHKLILDTYTAEGPTDGDAGSIDMVTMDSSSRITLKPTDLPSIPGSHHIFTFPDNGGGTIALEGHSYHPEGNFTDLGINNGVDLGNYGTVINNGYINTFYSLSAGFYGGGYNITLNGAGGAFGNAHLNVYGSGSFSNGLYVNNVPVSVSGHTHLSSDITNFNSSVSGLVSGIYAPLSGKLNQFASTSSAELLGIINDETGSGLLVFNSSPSFSGIPTVPTASTGTNTTQIASTAFVRGEISNLVASAPSTLDTLNELATALGNDANFSTTVTNNLAGKANLSGATFTGAISGPSGDFTSLRQNGVSVQTLLTNPVTGVGTSGYYTKWNGSDSVTSGIIFDNGSRIGINTAFPQAGFVLDINGSTVHRGSFQLNNDIVEFNNSRYRLSSTANSNSYSWVCNGGGNFGVGFSAPSGRVAISGGVAIGSNYNITPPTNGLLVQGNVGIGTTTPSGQLHVEGIGIFTSGIRLGSSSTSGTIIGLSATGTVPAIVFDTVGNNHGNQQALYDFRENGVSFISIDGIGNLQANVGNIVAIALNPATDNGAFIGQGMRRRLLTDGLKFGWGESITSVSEPGIDLFPVAGTHISSGILFRLSKNSNKTDVAFIVDGSSRVGIGTSTPSGQLHVVGTGIVSSRLGVGITSPQYALDVVGSGNFLNGLAISGIPLGEIIDDEVAGLLVAGSGINLNYNDSANTLVVDSNVSTSLVAGTGISLSYNVSTDELSINTSGVSLVGHTHSHSDVNNALTTLSQFTTNQNDLVLGSGGIIRISSSGALNITGFVASSGGDARLLSNVGSGIITLKHNDSGSSANNRIYCVGSTDFEIETNGSAAIYYDNIDNKWRVG